MSKPGSEKLAKEAEGESKTSRIRRMTLRFVTSTQETLLKDSAKRVFYNIITAFLTVGLILSLSVFSYGSFYFAYMPSEVV